MSSRVSTKENLPENTTEARTETGDEQKKPSKQNRAIENENRRWQGTAEGGQRGLTPDRATRHPRHRLRGDALLGERVGPRGRSLGNPGAAGRRAAEGMLDSCRLSRRSKKAVTAMFSSQNPGKRLPVTAIPVQ